MRLMLAIVKKLDVNVFVFHNVSCKGWIFISPDLYLCIWYRPLYWSIECGVWLRSHG